MKYTLLPFMLLVHMFGLIDSRVSKRLRTALFISRRIVEPITYQSSWRSLYHGKQSVLDLKSLRLELLNERKKNKGKETRRRGKHQTTKLLRCTWTVNLKIQRLNELCLFLSSEKSIFRVLS